MVESVRPDQVKASPQTEVWTERGIEPVGSADRLAPEQPERGLLWVVDGAVTVERRGRRHEISRGSVAAYRLGGGLSWSANGGTHVRWTDRPVQLEPGQVAPWTTDLALDVPETVAPPDRPRRKTYAILAIALSWMVALTVAWCYDQAHSSSLQPATGVVGALPALSEWTAEQRRVAAEVTGAFDTAGFHALDAQFPGGKASKLTIRVQVRPDTEDWRARLGSGGQQQVDRHGSLAALFVYLVGVDGSNWGRMTFRRGVAEPLVEVYHTRPGPVVAAPPAEPK